MVQIESQTANTSYKQDEINYMVTLYNVVSSDGYIATKDGNEDFISDKTWDDFIRWCRNNDAVVIGRKTYETLQEYGEKYTDEFESLKTKRAVVTGNKEYKIKKGYVAMSSPQACLALGENILISSGPILNTSFLSEKLVDKIIINALPVKIGNGVRPFKKNELDRFTLISDKEKSDGSRLLIYQVKS